MNEVSLTEAKDTLSALVDQAERTHEIITITRHGRRAAVLMAAADLDSMHQTIFWLGQPDVHEDIAHSRAERAGGKIHRSHDLRAEYRLPR